MTAGATVCIIDNLTVTSALLAGFDFPGGCTIKGNLLVIAGTLRFNPSAAILKFGGTTSQTIGGAGILEIGANCSVTIGTGSATILNRNLSLGKDILVQAGGKFTVSPGVTLTVNGEAVIN